MVHDIHKRLLLGSWVLTFTVGQSSWCKSDYLFKAVFVDLSRLEKARLPGHSPTHPFVGWTLSQSNRGCTKMEDEHSNSFKGRKKEEERKQHASKKELSKESSSSSKQQQQQQQQPDHQPTIQFNHSKNHNKTRFSKERKKEMTTN